MLNEILLLDQELFLWLNGLGTNRWDPFWQVITNKKTWIPLYLFITIILYRNYGWKQSLLIILCVVLGVALSDQITNCLKEDWVKRLRPCYNSAIANKLRLVKESCGGKYGYTSAHASNHFVIAIFIGRLFYHQHKWVLFILIFWAAIIAYSRVYIGVHFPLDIISGSFLGIIIGGLLFYIYNRILIKSLSYLHF